MTEKHSCDKLKKLIRTNRPILKYLCRIYLRRRRIYSRTARRYKTFVSRKRFAYTKTLKVKPEVLYKAVKKFLLVKKAVVYLLKRYSGLTNKLIGSKLGICYSAVSKINKDIQIIMDHLTFQGLTLVCFSGLLSFENRLDK